MQKQIVPRRIVIVRGLWRSIAESEIAGKMRAEEMGACQASGVL